MKIKNERWVEYGRTFEAVKSSDGFCDRCYWERGGACTHPAYPSCVVDIENTGLVVKDLGPVKEASL